MILLTVSSRPARTVSIKARKPPGPYHVELLNRSSLLLNAQYNSPPKDHTVSKTYAVVNKSAVVNSQIIKKHRSLLGS